MDRLAKSVTACSRSHVERSHFLSWDRRTILFVYSEDGLDMLKQATCIAMMSSQYLMPYPPSFSACSMLMALFSNNTITSTTFDCMRPEGGFA